MLGRLFVLLLALWVSVACGEGHGTSPRSGGGAAGYASGGTSPAAGAASANGGTGNALATGGNGIGSAAGGSGGVATGGAMPSGCTPGETQACTCAGGTTGVGTCDSSGTAFGPCECNSGGSGGSGGATAAMDGGTAGAGGSVGPDAAVSPKTETPKLHVSGAFLQDTSNKNVLLHGWMQPTASWFNGEGHRYTDPTDWSDPTNVAGMLSFLQDAATVMSDPSPKYGRDHGWYATFVRVNTDAVGGWTSEQGLVDPSQFNAWIDNFLVPYVDHLRSRGLYLVLCATGPMVVNVGGDGNNNMGQGTQQRMITFWETVANAPGIKSADNVMFELMNEPVAIETSFGANDWGFGSAPYWQALRGWMQPVVDAIRNTGADNVIWVPTLGWQGEPQGWAQYPISGSNIGVAAHFYPGYGGGVHDDAAAVQNLWTSNYKPAADLMPMVITEMMWYPNSPGGYDDLFNGTTAGFGNAVKNAIDNQGNVSFLVGFLADHLVDLVTTPPASCGLGSHEGSQAYFDWLPTYTSAAPTGHRFLH